MSRHGRSERGGAETLGLVVMTPVMMAAAVLLIWISRQVDTQAQIHTAAEAAAQAAVLQRTPASADTAARMMVSEMLDRSDLCGQIEVAVHLERFTPGGHIAVEISCWVSEVGIEVVSSGNRTFLWARATAGIDLFKQVGIDEFGSPRGDLLVRGAMRVPHMTWPTSRDLEKGEH
jgi:hypothetical protein